MAEFEVTIAAAKESDLHAAALLLIAQMREHRIERTEAEMLSVLRHVLAEPHWGFMLIARSGDQIAGLAYVAAIQSAEHGGKIGWVEELYVKPDHREQGIGTALMRAVLAKTIEAEMIALELEVDIEHRRVETLYQRLGFRSLPRSRWVRVL